MKNSDLVVFSMLWLVENSPVLVVLLLALAPVLSVCVAGYAVHVIGKLQSKGKK